MEFLQDMPGYMWVLLAAFLGLGIFLTILWIIVPFSIFGVKPLLKDMLHKLERIELHLERLASEETGSPGEGVVMAVDREEKEPPPV